MTKLHKIIAGYVVLSIVLLFCSFNLPKDENLVEHATPVTTISIIQENHKSSTSYVGVFKLDNGKLFDINVSPSTYATVKPGDRISLNLDKYDTKELEPDFIKFGLLPFVVCLLTFFCIVFSPFLIYEHYKENKK